jgi:hypothetical protein
MDNKVKLTKCQNHHHHGGVFDTWTKWGQTDLSKSVEVPLTPINTPPPHGESRYTHHTLEIPLVKLTFLV